MPIVRPFVQRVSVAGVNRSFFHFGCWHGSRQQSRLASSPNPSSPYTVAFLFSGVGWRVRGQNAHFRGFWWRLGIISPQTENHPSSRRRPVPVAEWILTYQYDINFILRLDASRGAGLLRVERGLARGCVLIAGHFCCDFAGAEVRRWYSRKSPC